MSKKYQRRSEFRAHIFSNVRDEMWKLLKEFKIPATWGYRIELTGSAITDDPKYQDYSLEFFALDSAVWGKAGKTSLVYPLEDGRELYVWVARIRCKPQTIATYQELWCAEINQEAGKPYGWQSWMITTRIPRESVKKETAILLNGLPLFEKAHEWTNGYSKERIEEILFPAAELYAESEPQAKFKVKQLADRYVPLTGLAHYPLSRESTYFYFKKYQGLKEAVNKKFTDKQEWINGGGKLSTERRN
jgi:hypothetical protein